MQVNPPYSSVGSKFGSITCQTSPVRLVEGSSSSSYDTFPCLRSDSVNKQRETAAALEEKTAKLTAPCAS